METSSRFVTMLVLLLFIDFLSRVPTGSCAVRYNVKVLGAVPDGKTETSKAFHRAWWAACTSTVPATIYVPPGRYFLRSAAFNGPCKSDMITFQVDGTLVAPSNYIMNGHSLNWIIVRHVVGLTIFGGTLDGRGRGLWDCKLSAKSCPIGTTSLEFSSSRNIYVNGLTSLDSQFFHTVISDCNNVTMIGMKFSAAGNSPNTDGIHIGESTNVRILNTKIGTGDDCISIGSGSKNLRIENIECGPGHGISIGSLGKNAKEEGVENVMASRVTFTGTQNGMRIKSWARPSTGFVENVVFQHIFLKDVENPIIIDQHYCPHEKGCPSQASGVKISDITYKDVRGTSATQVGIRLDCSSEHACTRIKFQDVDLTYKNRMATSYCSHAHGTTSGFVRPSDCL